MFRKIKIYSLAIAMTLGLANVGYSQVSIPYMAGAGTSASPYLINTARDLDTLSYFVRMTSIPTTSTAWSNTYFRVENNIDLSVTMAMDAGGTNCDRTARAANFIPIGGRDGAAGTAAAASRIFSAKFDGNGKVISNLTITSTLTYTGLFGYAAGYTWSVSGSTSYGSGWIHGLGLKNVNITSTQAYTGGLVGYSGGGSSYGITVDSCYVSGGAITGTTYVGGLLGQTVAGAYIYRSFSANVTVGGTGNVGGLLGNRAYYTYGCYAANKVNRVSGTTTSFGGFAGTTVTTASYVAALCYYLDTWKGTDGSGTNFSNITNATDKNLHWGIAVDEATMKTNCFTLWLRKYGASNTTNTAVTAGAWQNDAATPVNGGYPVLRCFAQGVNPTLNEDCFPILGKNNAWGNFTLSTLTNGTAASGNSAASPYVIATANDLVVLSNFVEACKTPYTTNNNTYQKFFKLNGDINMSSIANFQPIGGRYKDTSAYYTYNSFYGTFDGDNKKISNLKVNSTVAYAGLFGACYSSVASIKNLGLINPVITGTTYVGGLSGYTGTFNNCYVSGATITASSTYCGAGVGYQGTLTNCYFTNNAIQGATYVGGIDGYVSSATTCYVSGGTVRGTTYVGGITGYVGSITNCYTYDGVVSGTSYVGGISGNIASITGSYSTNKVGRLSGTNTYFGGLSGADNVNAKSSYYVTTWRGLDNGTSGGNNWTDVNGVEAGDPMLADDMKTNCFVLYLIGTNSITTGAWQRANSGQNNDWPTLRWENRGVDAVAEPVRGQCFPVLGFGDYRLSTSPADEDFDANIGATIDNPYLIADVADLQTLSRFIKDDYHVVANGNTYGKFFKVVNNINMTSVPNFTPIGGRNRSAKLGYPTNAFFGSFEGNDKVVSNVTITAATNYTGFFGYQGTGCVVKNLGLDNINLTSTFNVNDYVYAGGFAGYGLKNVNCFVTNSTITGNGYAVGGFVGTGTTTSTFERCYVANSTISGNYYTGGFFGGTDNIVANRCYVANSTITGGNYAGGFSGYGGTHTSCYVTNSNVTGTGTTGVGGFLGYDTPSQTNTSYTTGCSVNGTNIVGGFAATTYSVAGAPNTTNYIWNCYSADTVVRTSGTATTFGGFRGSGGTYPSTPTRDYYNSTIWQSPSLSGVTSVAGGTAQTTTQMKAAAFVTTMNASATPAGAFSADPDNRNFGYPILKFQTIKIKNSPADPVGSTTATLHAYISNNNASATPTTYKFRYKSGTPTTGTWVYDVAVADTAQDTYKLDATGLTGGATYYFQAMAIIGGAVGDTIFAPDTLSFSPYLFKVVATAASDVDYSKATLNGYIESGIVPTQVYFTYWKTADGEATAVSSANLATAIGTKTFAIPSGLSHSTSYSYRLKMVRSGITEVSAIQNLWTKTFNVTTQLPLSTTLINATLQGEVTYTGSAPTEIHFDWWLTSAGTLTATHASVLNYTSGTKTTDIVGLTGNANYSCQIFATIDGNVISGAILQFEAKMFNFPLTIISDGQTIEITDAVMTDPALLPTGDLPNFLIRDGGSLINSTVSPVVVIGDNEYAEVERKLFNERYAFVGTPKGTITAGTYLGITGSGIGTVYGNISNGSEVSMLKFIYETNLWLNDNGYLFLGRNTNMVPGHGYLAYVFDPGYPTLLTPAGTVVTQAMRGGILYNKDTNITATNNGAEHTNYSTIDGIWYSLSNPYPANLWTKRFIVDNTSEMSTYFLYVFDANNTWIPLDQDIDNRVKIGEGFFVSGKDGVSNRTHTFQFKRTQQTKATSKITANTSKITITSTANNESVNANICINEAAVNGFDPYDAYKMLGMNDYVCEPYFIVDSSMIAINSISVLPYECPMNISSKATNNVTLSFNNIPEDIELTLIDGEQEIAISNGDTYPTIVSEGQNAERFRIRLNKLSNGLANVTTDGISLWVANDALNINGENLKDVTIYNALGQVVYNKNLKGNSFKTLLDLPAGAYTAKASSKTSVENLKFVITK
ncbi:MAG: T9SS type A sorting domain-containing protein [Bacteroidales bacterium]|jgi:hypothetical protein|nr:T9SS type A sorting domain-containing protein [Bacteroidales bacterium]